MEKISLLINWHEWLNLAMAFTKALQAFSFQHYALRDTNASLISTIGTTFWLLKLQTHWGKEERGAALESFCLWRTKVGKNCSYHQQQLDSILTGVLMPLFHLF